jgi:cytochrome c oxidase cbb3-type subunit I/II
VLVSILVGGLIELIPTIVKKDYGVAQVSAGKSEMVAVVSQYQQIPATPLEIEGRDIYLREGCYVCHSQMVRPFRHETLRYGDYSRAESYIYDHPFQWGSKRTGPDLHRLAGRYPNLWHWQHMKDPRSTSPGSIMPPYAFLEAARVDYSQTTQKLSVLHTLGVPYEAATITDAKELALQQAQKIVDDLKKTGGVNAHPESELVALIGYLQALGVLRQAPALPKTVEVR